MNVHPTAVVGPHVELAPDVEVGPFCVLRGHVQIGRGTKLESHVVLGSEAGRVKVGENNVFSPGCVVGTQPQDLKYSGEPTELRIGNNNHIRECATINIGTPGGGGLTEIGNNCLIMAYVHIAHDCRFGDHVVVANATQFAGHVTVEDHVKIGGVCAFNQFIRLGRFSYIAGASMANKDILPFTIAQGNYAVSRAVNKIGLERAGFVRSEIDGIQRAVRTILKGADTMEEALEIIGKECEPTASIEHLVSFIRSSERGVAR